jgi:mRNA interferase HigB
VRVLGTEVLDKAKQRHADLAGPLTTWLSVAQQAAWKSLPEVRRTWRDTDYVSGITIFNIKGNSYRLLALVNYAAQTLIVKEVLTHAVYSRKGVRK